MELRREEFPVALQAYEVRGDREEFVAEQVVSSQTEADNFMSIYAGRLIKTRDLRPVENRKFEGQRTAASVAVAPRRRAGISPWVVILLIIIALVIVGFTTGWFQTLMNQTK